jgi:hypothetical protein
MHDGIPAGPVAFGDKFFLPGFGMDENDIHIAVNAIANEAWVLVVVDMVRILSPLKTAPGTMARTKTRQHSAVICFFILSPFKQ